MAIFGRKKEAKGGPLPPRRQPDPHIPRQINGFKPRSTDILREFRQLQDVYQAIAYITEKHPDAAMAVQTYVRLANNGHTMEIYGPDGGRLVEAEAAWRSFCQSVGDDAKGFDALIDQCHTSLVKYGGIGFEVVVKRDLSGIEKVLPILPQWLEWELDDAGNWHPYQRQRFGRVDLSRGNFFWVALDSEPGKPTGRLPMESALLALDNQLQFFADSAAVLRRAGYPRNDIAIDRESFIKSLPAQIRNDPKKLDAKLIEYFDTVQGLMRKIGPLDDIIHYSDLVVNKGMSGDNSRTIDLRAYNEIIDPQVMNGLGNMGVMLNRTTGQTETWGTVQFKVMVHTVLLIQQCSKREAESICNLFLRVHGYQGSAKFTHNPVDWETELQKLDAALKRQELHRRAEEYEWQDKPTAALEAMGIGELPAASNNKLFAYVGKLLHKSKSPEGEGQTEDTTE